MAAADDGGIQGRRSVDGRRADRGQQTADGDRYMRGEIMRLACCRFAPKVTRHHGFHNLHVQRIPMGARSTCWPCDAITRRVLATGFEIPAG